MKIYVWGRGIKFSVLRDRIIKMDVIEGFIDNNAVGEYLGKKIYKPSEIIHMHYDVIIVANNSTEAIYKQCLLLGIDLSKVIFIYKNYEMKYLNNNWDLVKDVLGEEYAYFLQDKYHVINAPTLDEVEGGVTRKYQEDMLYKEDYVRVRTLIMVANVIKQYGIAGEVAELGVFRGDFARCINRTFQDRKLFLFDTFEGFDPLEAEEEQKQKTCNDSFIGAFKDTSVQTVLRKMLYPENVVIKKGYFPESLEGLEEKFAFVSLDVDFEESTYQGLQYFYPRMNKGGYIFVHDYNYAFFDKVSKAVRRYEVDNNIVLKKVPLCDYDGTVVIVK